MLIAIGIALTALFLLLIALIPVANWLRQNQEELVRATLSSTYARTVSEVHEAIQRRRHRSLSYVPSCEEARMILIWLIQRGVVEESETGRYRLLLG